MALTTATAHFADATRLYQQGNLHRARDVAEQALLSLSFMSVGAELKEACASTACGASSSPASSRACPHADNSMLRRHHQLFGNSLLLLSTIYTAAGDYMEAERLLATCEGYWRDHLSNGEGSSAGDRRETTMRGDAVGGRDLDEGLAGVAYNRAVLQLEQLRHTSPPTASRLQERANDPSSVWPSLPPSPARSSPLRTQDDERRRQTVAAEVLRKYLYDAKDKLSHTLGSGRSMLADVHHSCGVCHYYLKDYVAALEAWQQSMAIRVHGRRCRAGQQGKEIEDGTLSGGVDELKVALTLEHIAQVYHFIEGKAADALKIYDAVAATRERYLGSAHPLYARTLFEKAVVASGLGHVKLARALLKACQDICVRSGSECDPEFGREVQRWREYVGTSS
ncbi:hypothetical protein ABB37_07844 [Leptomonas pyrrhocoris]|uniref:Tetratricopeptide repeat family protein n=1 Tax=Leptomonas pyrrhocoris TaxID=157538 RepID=A0A0M9FUV2_LEPPY|nr:hypothetical protein ABB37_07844 [Leptomonas pyrrhocoris]XP_015654994.1 hypothetical protein ABB37_07844 [Leptomonas pyrrhocoris]KPA76554.1 hypothetical protein ABB37_07844 [Leptomonas pyrrhocoris]KPA76555.1 hypothetical protein ABB37_07844 [Leptomonas pyrrhocoris]|eukprot:XP_015654993.1 hypothetical protein ABB37_07844 [Leptomonas pyrrhocoris]